MTERTKLRDALVRMLWRSVADDAQCTCTSSDLCTECNAMSVLYLGRWENAQSAEKRLMVFNATAPEPSISRKRGRR